MSRRVLSIVLSLVMVLNISFTNGMLYANENDNIYEISQENDNENNESHYNDEEQTIFDSIVSEEDEVDLDNLEPEADIKENELDNEEPEEDETIIIESDVDNNITEDEESTVESVVFIDIDEEDELVELESYYNSEVIYENETDGSENNTNESIEVSYADTIIESAYESSNVVEDIIVISTSSDIIDDENLVNNLSLFGEENDKYTIKFSDGIAKVLDANNNLNDLTMENITNPSGSNEQLPTNDKITGIKSGYQLAWWTDANKRYGQKILVERSYVFKEVKDIETSYFKNNVITLNAVWNIQIKYDANGHGSLTKSTDWIQQYCKPNNDNGYDEYYKTYLMLPILSDIDGYKFNGWSIDNEANSKNEDLYKQLSEPLTLYAIWEEQSAKITLNVDGGTIDNDKVKNIDTDVEWKSESESKSYSYSKPYSKELILPTTDCITKTGYSFDGWYDGNYSVKYLKVLANTKEEREYFAKWIPNTYSIDYVLNGGSFKNSSDVETSIKYGETYNLPTSNDIEKVGYTFTGWYDNSEYNGDKVTEIKNNEAKNHIYYAKWEIKKYDIKYYYFNNNDEKKEFQTDNGEETVTKWKDNYTPPSSRYIGDTVILPTAENIEVYKEEKDDIETYKIFKGWKYLSNQNGPFVTYIPSDDIPVNGDKYEFVAEWDIAYKVTLKGIENDEIIEYVKNGDIINNKYAYPTKENKKFKEWQIGSDSNVFDFNTPITENIEITAKFDDDVITKRVEFKITQSNNESDKVNNKPDIQYIVQNETARRPDINPSAEGYEFVGWFNEGYETPFNFNTKIIANTCIYAKWQIIDYHITYHLNNGNWKDEAYNPPYTYNVENKNDDSHKLPTVNNDSDREDLVRNHYEFKGWYVREDLTGTPIESLDDVVGDLNLYAKWEFNKPTEEDVTVNTINFISNGASGYMATQYIISNENNKLDKNAFTKSGYDFVAWSSSDGQTYTDGQNIESLSDNIILTAIWQQKPQQVVTSYNGKGSEYWGGSGGGGGGGVSYSPSMNNSTNFNSQLTNGQLGLNVPTNTAPPSLIGFTESNQMKTKTIKIISGTLDGKTSRWVTDTQTGKWKLYNANGIQAWNGFYQVMNVVNNGFGQRRINDTYYFDSYGQMVTGWIQTADSNWYYFEPEKTTNEGKMVTGWKQINGDYYYFNQDGSMARNGMTPDGRIVGADGKLMKFNM